MLIWWLSQEDCEQIKGVIHLLRLPPYIVREFNGLLGRAGRGRLWVDNQFNLIDIPWDGSKPMAEHCLKCGGIVIREEDTQYTAGLTGFITDLQLDLFQNKTAITA